MMFEAGPRHGGIRRALVVLAVTVALAATGTTGATAARGGNGNAAKPTAFGASTATYEVCEAASACDAAASATRAGEQSADASTDVVTRTARQQQWTEGVGRGSTTLTLAAASPSVTITYRWRVDEAASSAEAALGEGTAVGRVFLRGSVTHTDCSACVVEDETTGHGVTVADSFDRGTVPLGVSATAEAGEVSYSIVLRGPAGAPVPAGKLAVVGRTIAYAYVGCPISGSECVPETLPDATYAGKATAHARAQLLSITAEATGSQT